MESSYLPPEIIYVILSRTSSNTLGLCRVASKEWNKTTYDSKFKNIRFENTNIIDGFLIHDESTDPYSYFFASIHDEIHKICLDFALGYNVRVQAISADNGIILCKSENFKHFWVPFFFVCKPRVRLFQQIPNPRTRFSQQGIAISIIRSNPLCYKILRVSSHTLKFVKCSQYLILEVFDSEAWKWKRLKDVLLPYHVLFMSKTTAITACGVFHWLMIGYSVFSFNIEKEEWKIISLPIAEGHYNNINTIKYERKLMLTCMDRESYMHTWVLQSYSTGTWQKKHIINMQKPRSAYLKYDSQIFYGSDILVLKEYYSLKYYDLKKGIILYEIDLKDHYSCDLISPFQWDSE